MKNEQGDLTFDPVNMGQALGVLADVVANYVSTVRSPAIEDPKAAAQLNLTMFLHSLLMRSKHKAEMAALLDIISTGLREAAAEEVDDQGVDPTTADLFKPIGNDGVVNAEICFNALLLVGDADVTEELVTTWTQDQMDYAYNWAMRLHLYASDNPGVFVPERPDFIPKPDELTAQ